MNVRDRFFVSSSAVTFHMKNSYEITLVESLALISVIAVVNKTSFLSLFIFAHPSLLLFTSFPQRSMWQKETRAIGVLICSCRVFPSSLEMMFLPRGVFSRKSYPRVFDD